ncbi:MAG: ribosomal-protein-alanine N-acetyltransferase [Halomonadaceae bacterium T82-2]|nr:MAG: ribosomal-protein-alanine N-acetyltransferase [Halomonadaceae bacterium T82-2]
MLVLERLTPAAREALVAVERAGQAHPWSEAALADALASSAYELWGAYDSATGTELLGYAALYRLPFEAELQAITVAPGARRRGIARLLIERLLVRAAAWRSERLLLEVRASNAAALALYAAMGFREDGRRPNYYPAEAGRREAAVLMSRPL